MPVIDVLALIHNISPLPPPPSTPTPKERENTHKRNPTIPTNRNLRLIRINVHPRMSRRADITAPIARHDAVVRPPHRLLVDQLDGRVRLWLCLPISKNHSSHLSPFLSQGVGGGSGAIYLQLKIRLLKPRSHHGLGAGLLAARPDLGAVRRLRRRRGGHRGRRDGLVVGGELRGVGGGGGGGGRSRGVAEGADGGPEGERRSEAGGGGGEHGGLVGGSVN